jgi:ubiquinone/menaquinone biosynthesis C-methylase UbiE
MDQTQPQKDDQAGLWNGPAGLAWVDAQQVLDLMFKPFEDLLVAAVVAASSRRVLDVGCGTGSTTIAVARRLGTEGRCTGIDISEPMLALGRARAAAAGVPATFIKADAQDYPFEPAGVDAIISRFGVMFFADPVSAFANLRRAAADDGRLCVIAWRSAAENAFMTTAERAAAPLLPALPGRRADGPGQFAFADQSRVEAILRDGGWADIDVQPIDVPCTFPEAALEQYVTRLGPVGVALQQADERTRLTVAAAVRTAFAGYVHESEVRFTAACWMIVARAPAVAAAR